MQKLLKLSPFTFAKHQFMKKFTNSNLKNLLIKMPRLHIAETQKQRIKIKEKGIKYIPGIINIQILGSGAPGAPATVYLFTDQSRYLFNCGEGTQRLAHEHKTKLSRLEHIFITRTSWTRIGGLPGLSLTVQDAGVPSLTLHGPPGLEELFMAMKRFVILKDLKVNAPKCDNNNFYEDAVLSVKYVELFKHQINLNDENLKAENSDDNSKVLVLDDTDYFSHESNAKNQRCPDSSSSLPLEIDENKHEETSIMSFICKIKPRPGALSLEKCVDKGVPPGPLLGQLKNGEDIQLPNGTVVYAHEVRAPDDPGPVFIVLDIPSEDYLESLTQNNHYFEAHQATGQPDENLASLVLHFTPQHIIDMPIYRDFIDKFSPSTNHLILNDNNIFSGYVASHRIQTQLNQLNEHIFPLLNERSNDVERTNSEEPANKKVRVEDNSLPNTKNIKVLVPVTSLTHYHLRPHIRLDRSLESIIKTNEYLFESSLLPGFIESLDKLNTEFQEINSKNILNRIDEYPKIVFLGTGSCIPNKTRNVSAILVHTSKNSSILLDCGEGTCGQLIRFYGIRRAKEIFSQLKAIYISHLHADHHIGLIEILQMRRKILGTNFSPIKLIAPKQISTWLYFYDLRFEPIKNEYKLICNGDLLIQPLNNTAALDIDVTNLRTCLVKHCPHSFGVSFELASHENQSSEPFKITYSGDTLPCDELVKLGNNSTILIHEATMEDELTDQAKLKMHSTVSQAIDQGHKMNAKYILLTHFSQRYAKLPRIDNPLSRNVGIAFDNMVVTEYDLEHLHLLHPTLKLLFAEHCEEMEQKATKRAYKKQRMQAAMANRI